MSRCMLRQEFRVGPMVMAFKLNRRGLWYQSHVRADGKGWTGSEGVSRASEYGELEASWAKIALEYAWVCDFVFDSKMRLRIFNMRCIS